MTNIKKYTKKDGTTAYMFNAYLGVDPLTGNKKRTTRRGFKTQKEAKLALSKLLVEVDDYGLLRDDTATFDMVYNEWFAQHKREIKPTSAAAVESKFKRRILPKFGHLKIKYITRAYCQRVINDWADTMKSYNDYKIQTNLVFKYAVTHDILKVNPMDHVTLPKQQDSILIDVTDESQKYYNKDELRAFMDTIQDDLMVYAMFRLLSYTGARKGEIYALHWSDVDFKNKTINFKKTLAHVGGKRVLQTTKTAQSRRVISVDDETLMILKRWRKEQIQQYLKLSVQYQSDDKQPLFTMYQHKERTYEYCRLAYLNDKLKQIYKKNKQLSEITVHGFRHTHASLLFEAGASIKDVQARLGHTDIQTTMNIYTHVTNNAREQTADMFQKYMRL